MTGATEPGVREHVADVWCCHFLSRPGCRWFGPGVVTADGAMLCAACHERDVKDAHPVRDVGRRAVAAVA